MNVKIKYNNDNPNLWCVECKEEIIIGEKFGIIREKDQDGIYIKSYHCDCLPDEDSEIYISGE